MKKILFTLRYPKIKLIQVLGKDYELKYNEKKKNFIFTPQRRKIINHHD